MAVASHGPIRLLSASFCSFAERSRFSRIDPKHYLPQAYTPPEQVPILIPHQNAVIGRHNGDHMEAQLGRYRPNYATAKR